MNTACGLAAAIFYVYRVFCAPGHHNRAVFPDPSETSRIHIKYVDGALNARRMEKRCGFYCIRGGFVV